MEGFRYLGLDLAADVTMGIEVSLRMEGGLRSCMHYGAYGRKVWGL